MPNAKDAPGLGFFRVLTVGRTGTGKTSQIWTLKGKKFAYIFDPNALKTLRGLDIDYEEFTPEFGQSDLMLKGFNKGAKSDKPAKAIEPTTYTKWIDDINRKVDQDFFTVNGYDWLIFDSMTFLVQALMNRQLYLNNRFGDIEDLGDYRIVGSKLTEIFGNISTLPINIYATGHYDTYQDDKTKKIETQLRLPGRARGGIPLVFTDIFQTKYDGGEFIIRTRPEPRGLEDVRTSIQGLKEIETVTIKDFKQPEKYGIGALIERSKEKH